MQATLLGKIEGHPWCWLQMVLPFPAVICAMPCAGNIAGEGREACEALSANGAALPLGRLLLRAAKERTAYAAHAAICTAWALSTLLFSCPREVTSCPSSLNCSHMG